MAEQLGKVDRYAAGSAVSHFVLYPFLVYDIELIFLQLECQALYFAVAEPGCPEPLQAVVIKVMSMHGCHSRDSNGYCLAVCGFCIGESLALRLWPGTERLSG